MSHPSSPGPQRSWSAWGPSYASSAARLFGVLALFCLWLFPLSDAPRQANRKNDQRDLTDHVCGVAIVGCLLALFVRVAVARWLGPDGVLRLETVMLLAFGVCCAVKGEAITFLNDRDAPPPTPVASRRTT